MSRRYTVICHRCGKSTFVDLSKTVSDQRCRSCRGFLQGVDVSIGAKPKELKRKSKWKKSGAAAVDPVWKDETTPVVPVRKRWPRFFRWTVLGGLAVLLAAIGWSNYLKYLESTGGHRDGMAQKQPEKPDDRVSEAWRREATDTARKALAAKTADELLPLLFHPDASDDVIRRYYENVEKLPFGKELVEDYIMFGSYSENVVSFQFIDPAGRMRAFALVEKKSPRAMKIDWASLTGTGEMSLGDYMKTRPPRGVVIRARARAGQYYNGAFSDSSRWLSLRLSNVTDEDVIYGYVDRGFTLAQDMESLLPQTPPGAPALDRPVVVILKYPEAGLQPDQTKIIALLSDTWYQPDGLETFIEMARKMDNLDGTNGKSDSAPPEPEKKPRKPEGPGAAATPKEAAAALQQP